MNDLKEIRNFIVDGTAIIKDKIDNKEISLSSKEKTVMKQEKGIKDYRPVDKEMTDNKVNSGFIPKLKL